MALTNIQKNIAIEMQNAAVMILQLKPKLGSIACLYGTEAMASLTDADYAEFADFIGITVAEMTAAKITMEAIVATIGEYATGTNAQKLAKIAGRVP